MMGEPLSRLPVRLIPGRTIFTNTIRAGMLDEMMKIFEQLSLRTTLHVVSP